MSFAARSAPVPHQADGINLQKQRGSAAVRRGLWIEDVRLSEDLLERMNAERALMQQIAKVRGREVRVRNCCLPLGFAAALGAGAASAFFTTLRPWLLGLSVILLGFGFWQQHRAKQCAVRGRLLGSVLLWAALVVVVGMILFPQQIAGFIADRFYETGK